MIHSKGLSGERHLMKWEVAEDFRIVNEPKTRDQKSAGQNLLEDLMIGSSSLTNTDRNG